MANSAIPSADPVLLAPRAKALALVAPRDLANVAPGQSAMVTALALEADLVAWLAAVGIECGVRVTVLRRAAFGGPVHVRTHAGGEFAIARSLARAIATSPLPNDIEVEERE